MEYQPYPEYRQASLKWASLIPSSWDDTSVKFCFYIQLGKMLQPKQEKIDDMEFPYLKALHVNWDNVETEILPKMFASTSDIQKYEVIEGDLLVCEGGEVGRAAILKNLAKPAIIQNALHRVRNGELGNVEYFCYVLRTISDAGWFDILCNKATIAHLTGEKLGAIRFPVPPIKDQQKIATFLDYKTQQIDLLIEKKKALIEKLEEKRIAVITQAVTKGLDKNAKLKSSGVEWLGDVPEHWGVVKFKYFIGFQEGPGIMASDFRDEGIPLLRIRNIQSENVVMDGCNYLDPEKVKKTWNHFRCNEGDLIISGSASTGLVSEVEGDAIGSVVYTGLIRLWPYNQEIEKEYIRLLVASELFFAQIDQFKTGSTIQHFGPEHLRQMQITLPPIEEQLPIVGQAKKDTDYIDSMIAKTKKAIEKLEEYRSAIITSAVTGKIDIREIEIPKEVA